MAFARTVKDKGFLTGLATLHHAPTEGFDRMVRRVAAIEQRFQTQILYVRYDVARLQTRMLRRFDEVDARFDRLELRVTLIQERIA